MITVDGLWLTVRGPAGLAVPKLNAGQRTRYFLDVVESLHDIVEVRRCRVIDILTLPVAESIDESVASGVSLVPVPA